MTSSLILDRLWLNDSTTPLGASSLECDTGTGTCIRGISSLNTASSSLNSFSIPSSLSNEWSGIDSAKHPGQNFTEKTQK
jgi:hypothetical protein